MSNATEQLLSRLKALSDVHRLRLLALCQHGELSVSELTAVLGQSQPRVSQHLKQLCDAGLLRRFRDGKRVYYRLPAGGSSAQRRLLALIPADESPFDDDVRRLRKLRGAGVLSTPRPPAAVGQADQRAIHRALLDQTVAAPVGDLLDIGCGRGAILKLLASRANRAIGVDIDADVRDIARAELLLAGLANCSLRKGDMYRLPFEDQSFDTIVLDDVLDSASRPVDALREARRLLRPGGRLFLLQKIAAPGADAARTAAAGWSADAGLRLGSPRLVPLKEPGWMLSVATAGVRLAGDSAAA
jgi:ArsR family transcriptional regulator